MIAIVPNYPKNSKLRLTILLVSISLTLGLFSPGTHAQVVVFCNSCQDCSTKSSTPNTVLKLSQNLTQTFGGDCITMNSSNVVLDCNGKIITGKNLGVGVTNDGHDSVAITIAPSGSLC